MRSLVGMTWCPKNQRDRQPEIDELDNKNELLISALIGIRETYHDKSLYHGLHETINKAIEKYNS